MPIEVPPNWTFDVLKYTWQFLLLIFRELWWFWLGLFLLMLFKRGYKPRR